MYIFYIFLILNSVLLCVRSSDDNTRLNSFSIEDKKINQILKNILFSYSKNPFETTNLAIKLRNTLADHGNDILKYLKLQLKNAVSSSLVVQIGPSFINLKLQPEIKKIEVKCNNDIKCIEKTIMSFIFKLISKYLLNFPDEFSDFYKFVNIEIDKINIDYLKLITDLKNLSNQYFHLFLENPSFENLNDEIIPKFMKKILVIFEENNTQKIFIDQLNIYDSYHFIKIIDLLLKEFNIFVDEII